MKVRFTFGVLLATLAATVAIASPAMAKGGAAGGGGGGGGGGKVVATCASITSWTTSLETVNAAPTVVLRVGVFNGCVDEGVGANASPAVDMTSTDTATGKFLSASVTFANLGQNTFTYNFAPTATPAPRTLTLTVTRANGQLQDSRTATLAQILQSVPPAA